MEGADGGRLNICAYAMGLASRVLKVVSYSFMYWYMCRLDASHRCLVVDKDSPFVAVHFAVFVVVPVDARFIAVPVVSVIMSWCSHKLRVVRTCVC